MNDTFESFAKTISQKVLALSTKHSNLLETWSEAPSRPYELSPTECAGFTNKPDATAGHPYFTIDVLVVKKENMAQLRTWCIYSTVGNDGIERFDNIQLSYTPDMATATALAAKAGDITREDIESLLLAPETHVDRVTVSHESGIDQTTKEKVGERFDSLDDDLTDAAVADKIKKALEGALANLEALPK